MPLCPEQVIVVEPGRAHTLPSSATDHFHFVIHLPGLPAERSTLDKVIVARYRLGL